MGLSPFAFSIFLKFLDVISSENKEPINTYQSNNSRKLPISQSTRCRGSWTKEQKKLMVKYFKSHIKNHVAPTKKESLKFKEKNYVLFKDKTWLQIKVFVYNTYRNL